MRDYKRKLPKFYQWGTTPKFVCTRRITVYVNRHGKERLLGKNWRWIEGLKARKPFEKVCGWIWKPKLKANGDWKVGWNMCPRCRKAYTAKKIQRYVPPPRAPSYPPPGPPDEWTKQLLDGVANLQDGKPADPPIKPKRLFDN